MAVGDPQDPGGLTEVAPTPMSQFATRVTSSNLLPLRIGAGEEEVSLAKESAARGRAGLEKLERITAAQETERAAVRPEPITLPPPPSTEARPFLVPGQSVMSQLQSVMTGITQIALGAGGLKGGGNAIGAVAGLKGALEGWQAGDRERVDRSLTQWQEASKAMLANHRIRREAYADLLTDQRRTAEQILAEIEITARIDGDAQLAAAARSRNLDSVINHLSQQETRASTLELGNKRLDAELEHWKAESARMERTFQATQEQHRITNERAAETQTALQKQREITNARGAAAGARAERGLKLREETNKAVVTLQGQETALEQKLANAQVVRDAVKLLDDENILPKGATVWDSARAKVALQSKPGRGDIAQAVQVLQRLGTPLVIGTEVGLGTTGSALRLKVVGEAEAGNLLGAPKQFWDLFLPMAEKKWTADRNIAREHLKRLDRLPPEAAEPEILWKEEN